jgi:dihydrofolate reductase
MSQAHAHPHLLLLAVVGIDNAMGKNKKIPWNFDESLRYVTKGKTLLFGRKTYELMAPVCDGAKRKVVLSKSGYAHPGCKVVSSIADALSECKGEHEVYVMGGQSIFQQLLPSAFRVALTHVNERVPDADSFFPKLDPEVWKVISEKVQSEYIRCTVYARK